MNPLLARIALMIVCSVLVLIVAPLLGFALTLETLAGAFFLGGLAGTLIAARLPLVTRTPS